jgi:hypothetical protein
MPIFLPIMPEASLIHPLRMVSIKVVPVPGAGKRLIPLWRHRSPTGRYIQFAPNKKARFIFVPGKTIYMARF